MIDLSYRQSYPLPFGFQVEFSLDGGHLQAAWSPHMPKGKQFEKLLPAYREARGRFIASLGISAMVVEI
jgi:hypothetical protein